MEICPLVSVCIQPTCSHGDEDERHHREAPHDATHGSHGVGVHWVRACHPLSQHARRASHDSLKQILFDAARLI